MEHECAFSLKAVPRNKDVRTWPSAFAGRNRLMASWVNVSQMVGARGITQRNVPMRSKLLISTAALLAGIAVASAQNMPGGAQSGGAAGRPAGGAAQRR